MARSRCRRRAQAQGSTSLYRTSLCPARPVSAFPGGPAPAARSEGRPGPAGALASLDLRCIPTQSRSTRCAPRTGRCTRARTTRRFRLPWFRFKKRKDKEPQAEQAPAPAPPPEVTEPPAAADEDRPMRRRKRGSRGGRGRRKPAQTAKAVAETKPEPKTERKADKPEKPERKPERGGRSQRRRIAPKRAPLPPAKRELLVSADVGEQRVAVLEDDRVAEVYLERPERRSIAGNIYKGKVDNVLPGMEAAFVEIGLEKNGFLYVDEIVVPELEGRDRGKKIQDLISRGQDVLVQAVKDPMKSKGARLTTEISLPGRFVVYVPSGEGLGVSRRL